MALGNGNGNGQQRRLEQLAQSHTLTAVSRIVSLGGWLLLLILGGFFLPKLWDFGAGLQQQANDTAHALDRVTWRLQSNEAHDERQDRRMDFIDRRFDRLNQGRGSRTPAWPQPDEERDG